MRDGGPELEQKPIHVSNGAPQRLLESMILSG